MSAPLSARVGLILGVAVFSIAAAAIWIVGSIRELARSQQALQKELGALQEPAVTQRVEAAGIAPLHGFGHEATDDRKIAGSARAGSLSRVNRELTELREALAKVESDLTRMRHLSSGSSGTSSEAILDRFQQDDAQARLSAVEDLARLARLGDADAAAALALGLKDENEWVRRAALGALGRLDGPLPDGALDALMNDPSPAVRKELAQALAGSPPAEAAPALLDLLSDPSGDVVEEAVKSLVDIDYEGARPQLEQLLLSEDLDVAAAAGRAMRKFGAPELAEAGLARIAAGLEDPDPAVRGETLRRIRRVKTDAARGYVERALQDADPEVQRTAREIMVQLAP